MRGLANFSILRLIETNHTRLTPRSKHAVVSGAMHARLFMQRLGRFWREYAGYGAVALVLVPGTLAGARLKRVNRRLPALLVNCIAAEVLTLAPAAIGLGERWLGAHFGFG